MFMVAGRQFSQAHEKSLEQLRQILFVVLKYFFPPVDPRV